MLLFRDMHTHTDTHTYTLNATTNLPPWPVQPSAGRSGSAGWAWRWCCKADPGTFSVWWVRSWTHCGSPRTPCEWNEPASPRRTARRPAWGAKRIVLGVLGGVLHILLHLVLASSRYTFLHNGSDNSDSHHFKNKKQLVPETPHPVVVVTSDGSKMSPRWVCSESVLCACCGVLIHLQAWTEATLQIQQPS